MQLAGDNRRTARLHAQLAKLHSALERARAEGVAPGDVAELQQALRRARRRLREAKESESGLPALRLSAITPL
jgi:hypothetical protein